MEIIITDRESVERGLSVKAGAYALISITDPDKRRIRVRTSSARRAVVELRFHDAQPTAGFPLPLSVKPMIDDDAVRIADFVVQHRDRIKALVIHCEQGMSRSPAVGAGIAQSLGLDTTPYDRDFQPNAYVRELVIEAFEKARPESAEGDFGGVSV